MVCVCGTRSDFPWTLGGGKARWLPCGGGPPLIPSIVVVSLDWQHICALEALGLVTGLLQFLSFGRVHAIFEMLTWRTFQSPLAPGFPGVP